MAMPVDVTVSTTHVEQTYRLTAGGMSEKVYRVHFKVGDFGPFQEDFTQGEFVPERIAERQRQVAATLAAVAPR